MATKRKANAPNGSKKMVKTAPTTVFIGSLDECGGDILRELLRGHPELAIVGGKKGGLHGEDLQSVFAHPTTFGGPGYYARAEAAHRTTGDDTM